MNAGFGISPPVGGISAIDHIIYNNIILIYGIICRHAIDLNVSVCVCVCAYEYILYRV